MFILLNKTLLPAQTGASDALHNTCYRTLHLALNHPL